jgi:DnaA regulatory inactivator Hda
MNARQLPLELAPRPSWADADFVAAPCNHDATAWLGRWPDWPGPALVVWGPAGCGKTHLARMFLGVCHGRILDADDLIRSDLADVVGAAPAVVIDDAPAALRAAGEEALFHLINLVREEGRSLLLTGRRPPARWDVGLADLGSRLKAMHAVEIGAPDDALLEAVLGKHFSDRQLKIDGAVVAYMVARMERSFAAAATLVAEVDAAALAARRNVTIPLIRRVMEARQHP